MRAQLTHQQIFVEWFKALPAGRRLPVLDATSLCGQAWALPCSGLVVCKRPAARDALTAMV